MGYAIEIDGLRKKYKGAWAPSLDELSFSVKTNQVFGLLGPNGAGKTTCISILCGLVQPDEGRVSICGKDIGTELLAARTLMGIVPQKIALFANLSAMENFRYIGRLFDLPEHEITTRATALLQRLGLDKHAHKLVGAYSGGMSRRANIIASLLHNPRLLILDEPTAGVDVQSRALILDFLKEYKAGGNTILYTSHLMEEAEQICDEVVIIDEGKYITGGTPAGLIGNTADCRRLEDVFLHYTGHSLRD